MTELTRLAGVSVRVPAPRESAAFFGSALEFGVESGADGAQHLTVDGDYGLPAPRHVLSLLPGEEVAVDEVRFEVQAGGLDPLRARLEAAGAHATDDGDGHGVVLHDPHGIRIACREGLAPRDDLPPSALRPRRLGHVNLKVPDASAAAAFYQSALGLRLSEQVGDLLYFLRVGSEHHNVGFRGGASSAGVHHIAFELPGWESYRVTCDHLAGLGHRVEYGPGRHGPGHNLFTYLLDPHSGLRLELYADMAHIHDEESYEPIVWETLDRARTVNVWGPAPPKSFLD